LPHPTPATGLRGRRQRRVQYLNNLIEQDHRAI
jgi:transposase-like protein